MKRSFTIIAIIAALAIVGATTTTAAPLVFKQGRTVAYGVTLKPYTSTLLVCRAGEEPRTSDAVLDHPYTLPTFVWLDGGELEGWRVDGRLIATARPSQGPLGIGELRFQSYGRTVDVEIICER